MKSDDIEREIQRMIENRGGTKMNERIRELWIKAAREDSDPDNWDTQEQFIERFAELIVRECVDIAYKYDEPKLSGPGMIIGNRIEEHFGVEE
jgi:hypothetical protein